MTWAVCVLLCAALAGGAVLFEVPAAALVLGAEESGAALLLQTADRQSGYTLGVEAVNGTLLGAPRRALAYALTGAGNGTRIELASVWPQGAVLLECALADGGIAVRASGAGPLALLVIAAQDYDARASAQDASFVGDLDGRALRLRLSSGTAAVAGPRTLRLVGDPLVFTAVLENARGRAALVYGVYVGAFVVVAAAAAAARIAVAARTPPPWSAILPGLEPS